VCHENEKLLLQVVWTLWRPHDGFRRAGILFLRVATRILEVAAKRDAWHLQDRCIW
jgi:hypothetical protein